jgi:hypothetical protein
MFSGGLFADGRAIALGRLEAVPLEAEHLFALDVQDSQRRQYGLDPLDMEMAQAADLADNPGSYAILRAAPHARDEREVIACFGISQTFPDAQGVAWAFLGKGLGRDHHVLTRFAREVVIGGSALPRIEAIVRCADPPAETGFGQLPMMNFALQNPTPEVRWALAVGLWPACVLRKFGAAGETHMLLERIL